MSTLNRSGLRKPSAIAAGLIAGLLTWFTPQAIAQHQQCWEPLAELSGRAGPGGTVRAFATFDDGTGPALYVGGLFSISGDPAIQGIIKWDGTNWSSLETPTPLHGVLGQVNAITVFDDGQGPALYVGGDFTWAAGNQSSPGSVRVNGIAKWDGTTWSPLQGPSGMGVGGIATVNALTVFDDGSGPALYAAGLFTRAGGVIANRVAKWDGTTWSPLEAPTGNGVSGTVNALTVFDDGSGPALYAGGSFNTAGGVSVNNLAKWDSTAWSSLQGTSTSRFLGAIQTLAVHDDGSGPALFIGCTAGSHLISKWDGTVWSDLQGPDIFGSPTQIWALAEFDDDGDDGPALYVGGAFQCVSGMKTNGIAKWDGSTWHAYRAPRSQGTSNTWIKALGVFENGQGDPPELYAGGLFTRAGGAIANSIAKWQICQQPPCPCDYNEDGQQSIDDYFDYITDFFTQLGLQGTTDFDNNCTVTISDFFEFLNCLPAIAASQQCE